MSHSEGRPSWSDSTIIRSSEDTVSSKLHLQILHTKPLCIRRHQNLLTHTGKAIPTAVTIGSIVSGHSIGSTGKYLLWISELRLIIHTIRSNRRTNQMPLIVRRTKVCTSQLRNGSIAGISRLSTISRTRLSDGRREEIIIKNRRISTHESSNKSQR